MKRDFELIRNILLDVEAAPAGQLLNHFSYEGKAEAEVLEHIDLLAKANFIEAKVPLDGDGVPWGCHVSRLTWKGHEFLETARNETLWRKVLGQVRASSVSVSLDVLQGLLTKALKGELGLQ